MLLLWLYWHKRQSCVTIVDIRLYTPVALGNEEDNAKIITRFNATF